MATFQYNIELLNELMEDTFEIDKDKQPTLTAVNQVKKIVTKSGEIVAESCNQMEICYDGQIFHTGQNVFRSVVQSMDSNLVAFSMDDFAAGVEKFYEGRFGEKMDWNIIAHETFKLLKSSPRIDFKLGTFELEPPPKPDKVQKERAKKSEKTEKALVRALEEDKTKPKDPKKISDHVLESLVTCCRKNNNSPVNYFKFVLNPDSFWASVHNVYQLAQLVKDDKVKMSLVDDLPVIEPKSSASDGIRVGYRNQFNFRLTPTEYRQFLQTFNITSPAIPSF